MTDLVVRTGFGEYHFPKPRSYQADPARAGDAIGLRVSFSNILPIIFTIMIRFLFLAARNIIFINCK